jgi:tetratricopeptide (TPR) repeat protein
MSLKYYINYRAMLAAAGLYGALVFAAQAEPAAPAEAPAESGSLAGSYLSSQFARSSGDIDGAIRFLKRVHKTQPQDADISGQLMGILLLDGQVTEAVSLAGKLGAEPSQDPIAFLILTLEDIRQENIRAASSRLDKAFETGVGQLWLPLITAWVDAGLTKPADPVRIEELSGSLSRALPMLYFHLALINDYAGFKEAAAENFLQAVENPRTPPVRVMERLLQFYERAGKPAILSPLVNEYRAANPDALAESVAQPIASVRDGVAEVLFSMGSVMRGAGVVQDAVIYLQLALYLKPDLHLAASQLGDAYGDLKLWEKANAAYARVPQGDTAYGRARIRMALNLARLGKVPQAFAQLDALAKQPAFHDNALVAKGDLLRQRQQFDEAVAAYTQVLNASDKLQVNDWAVLFARATCYERLGKWDEAETDLMKALVLKPDQPDVLNFLGYSWLVRGERLDEALAYIERAVAAKPSDPQIIDSMGWALYLNGQYEKSVEYLEKAVAMLPGDAVVNDHLGDVYWRLGRKTQARFQWQRALSFATDAALAESLSRKLADGLPAVAATLKSPLAAAERPASSSAVQ